MQLLPIGLITPQIRSEVTTLHHKVLHRISVLSIECISSMMQLIIFSRATLQHLPLLCMFLLHFFIVSVHFLFIMRLMQLACVQSVRAGIIWSMYVLVPYCFFLCFFLFLLFASCILSIVCTFSRAF